MGRGKRLVAPDQGGQQAGGVTPTDPRQRRRTPWYRFGQLGMVNAFNTDVTSSLKEWSYNSSIVL
jgi:hypothetical protein